MGREEIVSIPAGALSEFSYAVDVVLVDGHPKFWLAEPSDLLRFAGCAVTCDARFSEWERRRLMKGSPLLDAVQRYVLGVQQGTTMPLMGGVL